MALAHFLVLGLGGLLVGIPILLHLLMKPKPKSFQFPVVLFLVPAISIQRNLVGAQVCTVVVCSDRG